MFQRSDEELIAASAKGDRDAFDELMRRHADAVISYLRGLVRDVNAAWDLAQETFLAAWVMRAQFTPRAKVRTWLFTIARNRYVDLVRKRARQTPEGLKKAQEDPPDAEIEKRELIHQAMALLEKLPDIEREVLVLRVLDGMPYGEISKITDVPENTLRAYASRALRRLREELE